MLKGNLGCVVILLAASVAFGQASAPTNEEPGHAGEQVPPAGAEASRGPEEGPQLPAYTSTSADRFWFQTEYLLWWIKDSHAPVLVTTGSPTDALPAAIGMPGTAVLFGGNLNYEERAGGRFAGGLWLDDGQAIGLEAGYFFLGVRTAGFTGVSTGAAGSAVLGRPFFDVLAGREDASLVALPGLAGGSVTVAAPSYLQGCEANVIAKLWQGDQGRLELVGGFRYLNLHEDLDIDENTQVQATSTVFPGDNITVTDHFDTRNNFYGGQAGLRASFHKGGWDLSATAKVALGDTHEVVTIAGATTILSPGGTVQSFNGGLLALPSNSGRYSHDAFAVLPEAGINLGYRLTRWLRAYVGYNFLYCSDVVRPGDQIDRNVNRQQVPTSIIAGPLTGPARPAFSMVQTDFWAQGVNLGLELHY